jgi:hypothetical protein
MNADTTQRSGKGNSLPNYCQSSTGSSSGNKTNIAGDIYARRAGIVTGIGELYRPDSSYVLANTDTALAENAEVMVSDKEGAICPERQFLRNIWGQLPYSNVTYSLLQLAVFILGTEDTSILHCYMAEADIERTAALLPLAGKASIRMSAHDGCQALSS